MGKSLMVLHRVPLEGTLLSRRVRLSVLLYDRRIERGEDMSSAWA